MNFRVHGIRRPDGNPRRRIGAAWGRSRRAVLRLQVEGLESRRLLAVTFNEFPIPTPDSGPQQITTGPDGNLWFTEGGANQIGRITPSGVITGVEVPTGNSDPMGITTGPDGNLWFTEYSANQIGRVTPSGVVSEFAIPTADSGPNQIVAGPDGNLWFTETKANQIGRITTAGAVTGSFAIPSADAQPAGITAGPDGALWFTESGNPDAIGRITTGGNFSPATPFPVGNSPERITTGPDGNLWFTDSLQVGQITPSGAVTAFQTTYTPQAITTGPDGNLWFVEGDFAAELNATSHAITKFSFPGDEANVTGITAGPDGNVWLVEHGDNKIGQVVLGSPAPAPDLALSANAPASVALGQDVTYTLTVKNDGAAGATGVTLTDTLPSGVKFVSTTGGITPTGGVLTFALGSLAAGASTTVTIVATPTGAGTLTDSATVSMDQGDPTPADNGITRSTTVTSPGSDGPRITLVQRFGFHLRPTTLVLTFDKALDPARAQDIANYHIVALAAPGGAIRIKSAVYDATTRTVTLKPAQRLNLHHRFRLTIKGTGPTGISDTSANLLDGEKTGSPGSDFVTIIVAGDLALTPAETKDPRLLEEIEAHSASRQRAAAR